MLHENTETRLLIRNADLDSTVIFSLRHALRSTHFKIVSLSFVDLLDQTGAAFLLDCVQNNPILENFCLNQVNSNTSGTPRPVVDHDLLCSIITVGREKLRFLDVSYNYISTNGNTFIADYLQTNPILQELDISTNRLNDTDAGHIARALRHNTNLKYLNLEDNDVSDSGAEGLRKAEFDSTTLNTASDSNHSVYINLGGESRSYNERIVFESSIHHSDHDQVMKSIARACRWKKIYSILSARNRENSNAQHLHEEKIPTALLPEMLTSIERYSEYFTGIELYGEIVAPTRHIGDSSLLSIVYEVARTWDKIIPLCENLGSTPEITKTGGEW